MAKVLFNARNGGANIMGLDAPEIGVSVPGQFIMVRCGGFTLDRPLGIAAHDGGIVTVVYAVKGGGTQWLAGRQPGDEVILRGPFGNGFSKIDGRVMLIGGGLGVPPLWYYAQHNDCDAALGFRDADNIVLDGEMRDACRNVVIATDDGSLGLRGNAPDAAGVLAAGNTYAAVFACGPVPMLKAAKAWAAAKGLPCWLSLEERMACGVGACLVCACAMHNAQCTMHNGVEYRRVCRDGPVFAADEVCFDE